MATPLTVRREFVTTSYPMREAVVTPSNDTVFLPSMIQALEAGDIAYQPAGGGDPLTRTLEAGEWIPVQVTQVLATGTTATNIRRVW